MSEPWMLGRLSRETQAHHAIADADRLAIAGIAVEKDRYTAFLARVFGFEAPLEAALVMTDGLERWLDLRGRGRVRLLRADLQALGVRDPNELPRCSVIAPFQHPADALGWVYAVEHNTLLHNVIERHLRGRIPEVVTSASAYLAGQQRSYGQRLRELGVAMDRLARDVATANRIVVAAKAAFRAQHKWYDTSVSPRTRAATEAPLLPTDTTPVRSVG